MRHSTHPHSKRKEKERNDKTKVYSILRYVSWSLGSVTCPSASIQSWGHVRTWLGLQVPGKWDSGEKVPHWRTSSSVTSLHEFLHRTRTSGSTLKATQLLCRTDRAVTSCRLPQSHRGAWSYPKDPACPSTTLMYEVTTLASPGLPPFGWTSKMLEQARKHNELLSIPELSSLTISEA